MPDNISVVPISRSSCNPFTLEVMVFSPEAGFMFKVAVERSCSKATATEPAKALWKLAFDLFRKIEGEKELVKIVHVSYTAENEVQAKKIQATGANGINQAQSEHLVDVVHPKVKKAENIGDLAPAAAEKLKKSIKKGMQDTVSLAF